MSPYGADGLFAGFLYKLSAPTALLVLSPKVEEASLPLFYKNKEPGRLLALLKSAPGDGAQPSWLWGWRASCLPTRRESDRQDAYLPHSQDGCAPRL